MVGHQALQVVESARRQTPFHLRLHLCPAFSRAPPSPPPVQLPHTSQPLGPPPNATRPLLCTLSACAVVGEPHQKLWPALINCRLYCLSSGRNRLVSHQISFRRHGKSASNRRASPDHPSLGICHCCTRLAVRKAEKMGFCCSSPWDSGSQFFDQRRSPERKNNGEELSPGRSTNIPSKNCHPAARENDRSAKCKPVV